MKITYKAILITVVAVMLLTGCALFPSSKDSEDNKPTSKNGPDWKPTAYSIDEIKGLSLAKNNMLDYINDDDITDEALKSYNILLGYTENVIGVNYKLYHFYHVDFETVKSYVIKIVLEDWVDDFEAESSIDATDERVIMLSCNEGGTDVQSGIEPFLMTRKWTEDLSHDFSLEFPDYHINTWYINLDYMVPHVSVEKYTDFSDYTYFYNEDFYKGKNKYYTNSINVILPAGKEEDVENIFNKVKPILKKYCVTAVTFIASKDETAFQKLIDTEEMTGNNYSYDTDNIEWSKFFKVE